MTTPPRFQVGDVVRVRATKYGDRWHGRVGTIVVHNSWSTLYVVRCSGVDGGFYAEDLSLVYDASDPT